NLGCRRVRVEAMSNPSVVYVLPDFLGGVATVISNVLQFRESDVFKQRVVLTRNTLSTDARIDGDMHADECTVVEYRLPVENLHAVLRRLRRAIGPEPGVLVATDFLELALATSMDCGRTVIQILHGDYDYYYDLAERHQDVVDAFVTVGKPIEQRLKQRLPHRADDIFLLPHPIALPA